MSFFINWFDKVFSRKEICTAYRHLTPLRFRRDECKPPSGTARSSLTTGDLKRQMLFPALPRLTSLRLGDFVLLLGRSPKAGQADRQAGRKEGFPTTSQKSMVKGRGCLSREGETELGRTACFHPGKDVLRVR